MDFGTHRLFPQWIACVLAFSIHENLKILCFSDFFDFHVKMSQEMDENQEEQPIVRRQPEKWGKIFMVHYFTQFY
jgi:hypothetical protein